MERHDAIVVGAGLAGLTCARALRQAGVDVRVLDAADAPGGRVRTDRVGGFLLDRGFQVLLTAYPECRATLDYDALVLRRFAPGALVRTGGRLHRLADPWRAAGGRLASLLSPAATMADKLRVAALRARLRKRGLAAIFAAAETTTDAYLREAGFSSVIRDRFFRPFLGGVFLESDLETSSRMFEFVFKMFAEGDAALPARGMQAVPEQLAADLGDAITCGVHVARLAGDACVLADGTRLAAERVVVAVDGTAAARLLGDRPAPSWRSTTCFWFDAPEPPVAEPILVLDGEGGCGAAGGPVNNLCVVSQVAPEYAPPDRALVAASVIGAPPPGHGLEAAVRAQLGDWFGSVVRDWRLLRRHDVPHALPALPPGTLDARGDGTAERGGYVVCGDHVAHPSIEGAMRSGRRAAEIVLGDGGVPEPAS